MNYLTCFRIHIAPSTARIHSIIRSKHSSYPASYLYDSVEWFHIPITEAGSKSTMTTEAFDVSKAPTPIKLAHFVLRTSFENYNKMIDFYTNFVGGVVSGHKDISFIQYDNEHHRIAILRMKNILKNPDPRSPGLDHVCFTYASLKDMAAAYRTHKARGIVPHWCSNHGPGTSLYYRDPDGNQVECQVDNFDDMDEAIAFMHGPEFMVNPIGVDFDPEELFAKLDQGIDEKVLKKRADIGPRTELPPAFIR
jgi:catechol 2,3-dioxygenase-like lactoylglutathione lyase family enzyme